MSEPTTCAARCPHDDAYCDNCDRLVGLPGVHVIGVDRRPAGLVVEVESPPAMMGCPTCGVVARSHGRRTVTLVDIPCFGAPTRVRWRKRTWTCPEPSCPVGVFTEQDEQIAKPRAMLTTRACRWATEQVRREHASIAGLARQLATTWRTVWTSIEPILQRAAADESRFAGVTTLGVDEHLWHHVSPRKRGPKELTGMVDLTRDKDGRVRARLLDLVPGRSGTVYKTWLDQRGKTFKSRVEVASSSRARNKKLGSMSAQPSGSASKIWNISKRPPCNRMRSKRSECATPRPETVPPTPPAPSSRRLPSESRCVMAPSMT